MKRPAPKKLGHLVLKVRDIHKSVAFYTEIVGLEVSDWIEDQMVFLRCGSDHHDLGLAQIKDGEALPEAGSGLHQLGLEHFCYEVESFADIEAAVEMLKANKVEIVRGPGKHGPGENCFLVFRDPDGNFVEFYCEMIQVAADKPHIARVWPDTLDAFDQWHFRKFAVPPPPDYLKRASKTDEDV